VDSTSGRAHDRDDLLDARRVGGVANPLVAGRAVGKIAGHGRERAGTAGGIEHPMGGHVRLLWSGVPASLQPRTRAGATLLDQLEGLKEKWREKKG
jgi:hypothetical protein